MDATPGSGGEAAPDAAAPAPAAPKARKYGVDQSNPRTVPLDFSFMELEAVEDMIQAQPFKGYKKRSEAADEDGAAAPAPGEGGGGGGAPAAASPSGRRPPKTKAVLLSNNQLSTLEGLPAVMDAILDDPPALSWLDISCNNLTALDDVFGGFPELQALYMHGNGIENLRDLGRLRVCQKMRVLTCHGNPITENPNYRNFVVSLFPNLRQLDFAPITRQDKNLAKTWSDARRRRKARREAQGY